jgi:hypothetical protein
MNHDTHGCTVISRLAGTGSRVGRRCLIHTFRRFPCCGGPHVLDIYMFHDTRTWSRKHLQLQWVGGGVGKQARTHRMGKKTRGGSGQDSGERNGPSLLCWVRVDLCPSSTRPSTL